MHTQIWSFSPTVFCHLDLAATVSKFAYNSPWSAFILPCLFTSHFFIQQLGDPCEIKSDKNLSLAAWFRVKSKGVLIVANVPFLIGPTHSFSDSSPNSHSHSLQPHRPVYSSSCLLVCSHLQTWHLLLILCTQNVIFLLTAWLPFSPLCLDKMNATFFL